VNMKEYADRSDLAEFNITKEQRKKQLEGGTYISLSPTIAFDTRDNRFSPTTGWLSTISLTGAYGIGNDSYTGVAANVRRYLKIRDGITLALNAQGGTTLLGDVPDFNMYRLGGTYSVRGFQEGGLGIGNGFLMGSAELRAKVPLFGKLKTIPVLNTLTAVGFVDAGTLMGESDLNKIFNRPGNGLATGFGVRFNMPGVGPIRIDYAIPLTGKGDYTRYWSFGIGEKF
jgi:outer membrane protein insertion porin family